MPPIKQIVHFDATTAFQVYKKLKPNLKRKIETHSLQQKIREEINISVFNLQKVEIAEAQLWYQDKILQGVDTKYFDGAPLGVKHWYCQNEKLVAVEVASYEQDEKGAIFEHPLYTILTDPNATNDSLIIDRKSVDSTFAKKIFEENRKEWKILNRLARKYKPQK